VIWLPEDAPRMAAGIADPVFDEGLNRLSYPDIPTAVLLINDARSRVTFVRTGDYTDLERAVSSPR
jgi:hypothetical protein